MRRKDREVTDIQVLEDILRKGIVCRVALHDEPFPYIVPLNYGYKDNKLYIHCANEGHKLELIEKNPKAAFVVDIDSYVDGSTMRYRSVMGYGQISLCESKEEKEYALKCLIEHFGGEFSQASLKHIEAVTMLVFDIESLTGKINKKS